MPVVYPREGGLYVAYFLMLCGILGATSGLRYLLKPGRTQKRMPLLAVRIGVGISILAINLAIVGLRDVFGG